MKTNIQNITIVSRFPLTTYKSEPYSPGLWYTDNLPILFTIHIKKFRHCQTIEVHHFTFWKLLHICIRWRILLLSERLWPKASSGNPPHAVMKSWSVPGWRRTLATGISFPWPRMRPAAQWEERLVQHACALSGSRHRN